jgi:hypothetical protein
MNIEIDYIADDNFHIPIKYSTKGTHLPPPGAIGENKKMLMISSIINLGSRLVPEAVCYSMVKCTEGKCKGAITISRESKESILWQCTKCITKGIITDFIKTPYTNTCKQDNLDGSISIQLSSKQYSAIVNIRGLPEAAHSMVMCSTFIDDSTVLIDGEEDAFQELGSTISEELDYDMCKKSDQTHLFKVSEKIEEILECDIHIC